MSSKDTRTIPTPEYMIKCTKCCYELVVYNGNSQTNAGLLFDLKISCSCRKERFIAREIELALFPFECVNCYLLYTQHTLNIDGRRACFHGNTRTIAARAALCRTSGCFCMKLQWSLSSDKIFSSHTCLQNHCMALAWLSCQGHAGKSPRTNLYCSGSEDQT